MHSFVKLYKTLLEIDGVMYILYDNFKETNRVMSIIFIYLIKQLFNIDIYNSLETNLNRQKVIDVHHIYDRYKVIDIHDGWSCQNKKRNKHNNLTNVDISFKYLGQFEN